MMSQFDDNIKSLAQWMFTGTTFGQVLAAVPSPNSQRAQEWNDRDEKLLNMVGDEDKRRDLVLATMLLGQQKSWQEGYGRVHEWNLPLEDGTSLSLQYTVMSGSRIGTLQDYKLNILPQNVFGLPSVVSSAERHFTTKAELDTENLSDLTLAPSATSEVISAIHGTLWRSPELVVKAQALKAQLS